MGKQLSLWNVIFNEGVKPLLQAIVIFPIMVLGITILFGVPIAFFGMIATKIVQQP